MANEEINETEIHGRKIELECKKAKKVEKAKELARTTLTEKIAQGDYSNVLRLATNHGITIPEEHLLKATEYVASVTMGQVYSVRGEYPDLVLAERMYRHFGRKSDADAVKKRIEEWDRQAERDAFDRAGR